jgi:hypothetical protein
LVICSELVHEENQEEIKKLETQIKEYWKEKNNLADNNRRIWT